MRRLVLDGTNNTRDLGGYPTSDGSATQFNRFYRSDVPKNLSQEDISKLRNAGIATVIDLRSNEEAERTPCALDGVNGFAYHHIKAHMDMALPADEIGFAASYFIMADEKKSMLRILKTLAGAQGAVLYHCTAGKDRTGVLSAILLSLAGVQEADILADYLLSQAYLQPWIRRINEKYPGLPGYAVVPQLAYMETFLSSFFGKYESAEHYLCEIGLSKDDIDTLKMRLTE